MLCAFFVLGGCGDLGEPGVLCQVMVVAPEKTLGFLVQLEVRGRGGWYTFCCLFPGEVSRASRAA